MLVSCADDKTVKLHDVQSASTLHTFPELKGSTTRVAFHPSGTCIATAGSDSSVRVSLQDFSHVPFFLLLHLLFSSFFLCHFFFITDRYDSDDVRLKKKKKMFYDIYLICFLYRFMTFVQGNCYSTMLPTLVRYMISHSIHLVGICTFLYLIFHVN